ncbi:MAG: hypothetical protein IKY83_09795 [Proteobacteria bacterium]|nr:hypothetical protein [Pseudomonadota bacterium]
MMDGTLQRQLAYRLIDELPLDRLDVVIQMLEMITGKHDGVEPRETSAGTAEMVDDAPNSDVGRFFGCLKSLPDGLAFQKEVRDEWD